MIKNNIRALTLIFSILLLAGLLSVSVSAFDVVDGTPAFNMPIGNTTRTYQLWFRIVNLTEVNASNYSYAMFYLPYGIINATNSCNAYQSLVGLNSTYSNCALYVNNDTIANGSAGAYATGGASLNVSITVKLNISAFSEASTVTPGRPTHGALLLRQIFMRANMSSGSTTNTTNSTVPQYGVHGAVNPRPYFVPSQGLTFGNNVTVQFWNQTDSFYVIQLPVMTFNATSMRPEYQNNSFGEVLYFDKGGQMEMPTYMRLYSYSLNFTFLDVANGSSFTMYNPVNVSTSPCTIQFGDCPPESPMPLLTQTNSFFNPITNQTVNFTISVPSPNGYDLYVNGTLRVVNFSNANQTTYWGLNATFLPGMLQNSQGIFAINVTDANIAKSTNYTLYFTIMNQTDTGGGSLAPTSPIYIVNQSISGWDPLTPPAFGQNLTISYVGWLRNRLQNWTFYNASVRYFVPTNVTPRSPTNDSHFQTCNYDGGGTTTNCTFNMTRSMNFSWWNGGKWDSTGVVNHTSCSIFNDSRQGQQSGGNVTVCFAYFDLLLTSANFNSWNPNSTASIVGLNFTAEISFPVMDQSNVPGGTAGQANSYNITFQASMQTNLNLTDKVPNIAAAGCASTTITLDGQTITCGTNYTIGSLTLNSVSQGSHSVSVSYTPPASSSSSSSSGGSGGRGPGCDEGGCGTRSTPTPTPNPTPPPSIEKKIIDSQTGVVANFGKNGASFELTYEAGASGFYGDLTWRLPFEYSEYALGQVHITPRPKRVLKGSVIATWENVDLKPRQDFKVKVSVTKPLDRSVLDQFAAPSLQSKPRPAVSTAARATPTAAPTRTALQPDFNLIIAAIAGVLIAAYYFGVVRRKRSGS